MWKVYANLNAFYIVKGNEIFRRNKAFVEIRPHTAKGTSYDFFDRTGLYKHLDLSEIVKEDGVTPYTQQEWNDFMDEFSGFSPASGGSEAITFYCGDGTLPTGERVVTMGGGLDSDLVGFKRVGSNYLFRLNGDGQWIISSGTTDELVRSIRNTTTQMHFAYNGGNFIELNSSAANRFYMPSNGANWDIGDKNFKINASTYSQFNYHRGNIQLGGLVANGTNINSILLQPNPNPSLSSYGVNAFAKEENGVIIPQFILPTGDIIKLFKKVDNIFGVDLSSQTIATTGNGDFDNWMSTVLVPLVDAIRKALRDSHGLVAES